MKLSTQSSVHPELSQMLVKELEAPVVQATLETQLQMKGFELVGLGGAPGVPCEELGPGCSHPLCQVYTVFLGPAFHYTKDKVSVW